MGNADLVMRSPHSVSGTEAFTRRTVEALERMDGRRPTPTRWPPGRLIAG